MTSRKTLKEAMERSNKSMSKMITLYAFLSIYEIMNTRDY